MIVSVVSAKVAPISVCFDRQVLGHTCTGRIQNWCNSKDWRCSHCVIGVLEGILGLVRNRNLCHVIDDEFLAITCACELLNFHWSVRFLTVA